MRTLARAAFFLAAAVLPGLFVGCGRTTKVSLADPAARAEINRLASDRESRLRLEDGTTIRGTGLVVEERSARFRRPESGSPPDPVPNLRIESLRLRDPGRGARQGLLAGLLAGMSLSAPLLVATDGEGLGDPRIGSGATMAWGTALGGVLGWAWGSRWMGQREWEIEGNRARP